jgi:hypothetical protein
MHLECLFHFAIFRGGEKLVPHYHQQLSSPNQPGWKSQPTSLFLLRIPDYLGPLRILSQRDPALHQEMFAK